MDIFKNSGGGGFVSRLKAFIDLNALILIFAGLFTFSLRIQFTPGGFVNLPVAFTIFQTAGLMMFLAGVQLIISRLLWPSISFTALLQKVDNNELASAVVLLGIFVFNGLGLIGTTIWLSLALGAGISA